MISFFSCKAIPRTSRKLSYTKTVAKRIGKAIAAAQKIAIITHRSPDGDAIGSNLGLRLLLEQHGKQVTSVCVDPVPGSLQFLPQVVWSMHSFQALVR